MTTNFEEYFKNRATVRNFTSEVPSEELISHLLELAMRAPTTGTMQLYSVISTRKEEMREQLARLHFNQPASKAPLMLTFCADFNRFSKWCALSNAEPAYDNFLSFTSAMLDAAILCQQFVTIAEMNGLGTCYLGTCLYNAPEIAELLNLPTMVVPVCCLAVGYPTEEVKPTTERLDVSGILYSEQYPALSANDIQEIYKPKDEFPANLQFIIDNGKESLAQVFTDIRYPRAVNEPTSKKLLDFLKQTNFL